jgi:hypothetical protein
MNKFVLSVLWSALLITCVSAQTVQWAHTLGLPSRSRTIAIANDSLGNSYTLGTARNSTESIMGVMVVGDLQLEKRDSLGSVLWTKRFPGHGGGFDIAATKTDDIIITGAFYDSIYFGGDTLKSAAFAQGMFLASFTSDGSLNWAHSDTSQWGGDLGVSITIADESSFYVCGISQSIQGMLRKYDHKGQKTWEKVILGVRNIDAVVLDRDRNIYLSGTATPEATFDTVPMPKDSAVSGYVSFVAKLDPSGKALWLRANPFTTFNISTSLAIDGFGYLSRVRQSGDFMSMIYEVIDPWNDSVMTSWSFPVSTGDFNRIPTNCLTSSGSSNQFFGPYFVNCHNDTTVIYQLGHGISFQGVIFLLDTIAVFKGGGLRCEAISLYNQAIYLSGYFHDPTLSLGSVVVTNDNNSAKFETSTFLTRITPTPLQSVRTPNGPQPSVTVYPNPATDAITIEREDASLCDVMIYNMLGAIQYHQQTSSSRLTIDPHDLIAGAYTLVIRDKQGMRTASFIRR